MFKELFATNRFQKGEVDMKVDVQITQEAYTKLRYYIDECETEISGFGKVTEFQYTEKKLEAIQNGGFKQPHGQQFVLREYARRGLLIYDIEILPQEATGGHASIDPETIAKFMTNKMAAGEEIGDYKVWWHSHVHFNAYFSDTDLTTIEESTEFPYLISIVMNKRGESQSRLDINDKFPRFSYVDIKVQTAVDPELREQIRKEIIQKVKKPKMKKFNKKKLRQMILGDE